MNLKQLLSVICYSFLNNPARFIEIEKRNVYTDQIEY